MAMTGKEMVKALTGVPRGAKVFVSYDVGREPTVRAIREADRARREGLANRHFIGYLTEVRTTKRGDSIFTVLCDNRDDERRGAKTGYRTFNPSLGQLHGVEVLEMTPSLEVFNG